ncbi:MAG: efflux RND transporter periplasmic adaptor subunit [Verrucomicrobiae bacterium]|nr:efflux RND transporter periplasmic adaptor subunit [Verrucomicrobiae bacterium]
MKIPRFRNSLAILLVLGAAGFAIYHFKIARKAVVSHTVEKGDLALEVMGTGTLEARIKTTISARIQERLVEVLVDQGDPVEAGQLLARLDDAESKQQVAIAEATLATAQQTLERVRADLARSEAVLAQAKLDYERKTGLAVTRSVAQADADKAAESLRVAEADLSRSHATIAEATAQVGVAEKTLLLREELLGFTELHSPYAGLVIRRDRDPGDVLVPGASLMQIISLDELWVSAWVDETSMTALATDQNARIVFRSDPDRDYPGKVSRLGREMDRETREFLVDVRVTELPPNWAIGQRAEVFIETGNTKDAVLLPPEFLGRRDGHAGAFVNVAGRARWRDLSPGAQGRDLLVIAEGLQGGEEVVRVPDPGRAGLSEGQRITTRP